MREGFTHNGAFFQHCSDAHGAYAEYRKRLLWRAQHDGFKPLLPWVKRHILRSATFHLTLSVPGSFSFHWNHPEAIATARTRCEVACVVCARKDWLENLFPQQRMLWGPNLTVPGSVSAEMPEDPGPFDGHFDWLASPRDRCFEMSNFDEHQARRSSLLTLIGQRRRSLL